MMQNYPPASVPPIRVYRYFREKDDGQSLYGGLYLGARGRRYDRCGACRLGGTGAEFHHNPASQVMTAFHFAPQAVAFLTDLKANNNREWFAAHKADYEVYVKEASVAFCRLMVEALDDMTGAAHQAKIFRIYRDVRFAKDKTPYKTYQHILFAVGDHRQTDSVFKRGCR